MLEWLLLWSQIFGGWALGDVPKDFRRFSCARAVAALVKEWGSHDQWIRRVDPAPESRAFKSPTKKIGEWVEIIGYRYRATAARKVTPRARIDVHWERSNCRPQVRVRKVSWDVGKNGFSDEDLKRALARHSRGVIYTWAPGMYWSMDAYPALKRAAAAHGAVVIPLVWPDMNVSKVGNAELRKSKVVASVELNMRSLLDHPPGILAFKKGKILGQRRGADTAKAYREFLRKEFAR